MTALSRLSITLLCVTVPANARALLRVASDGKARVSEIHVLVEEGAWTVRAKLDGHATRVALLIPVPGRVEGPEIVSQALLDAVELETAPRMLVFDAKDPCAGDTAIGAPGETPLTSFWPSRQTPEVTGFIADTSVDRAKPELDADTKRALARAVRDGSTLVVVTGPAPGKMRGFWTPPVRVKTKGRVLNVGLAAPQITPGKRLRLEIFGADGLRPTGRVIDLPSGINLPEVTFEDPLDLYQATAMHVIRRERAPVRVHAKEKTRHLIAIGPSEERARVEVGRRTGDYRTEWFIRRVWRKPIRCEARARYLNNVRIQQKTEIQTYAALTGRKQGVIQRLQQERGYLLQDGRLKPVSAAPPP